MTILKCSECGHPVSTNADACPGCGAPPSGTPHHVAPQSGMPYGGSPPRRDIGVADKSNGLAFFLGIFLGPVGLWYKGNWAAGFAWLVMTFVIGLASSGILAPFMWIGMAIHAAAAESKG